MGCSCAPESGCQYSESWSDFDPDQLFTKRLRRGPLRVIFLDVDGVLHPAKSGQPIAPLFRDECLRCLKNIVTATAAEIVLSSSWRLHPRGRTEVDKVLQQYGIGAVIGATPNLGGGAADRAREVAAWLACPPDQVMSFVVLDDLDLVGLSGSCEVTIRFVRTPAHRGLGPMEAQSATRILLTTRPPRHAGIALDLECPAAVESLRYFQPTSATNRYF
mmetsp:Transcript_79690/g.213091  ORF Transcript_79690/g.213091 Transcript_79690/m.213091 type:complete len:218 (+) Transcript_79690:3-656(+)